MRRPVPIATGLVGAALVVFVWWVWSPSDERQIRNRLDALAETVSIEAAEPPVARMARAVQIGRYFTDDVIVDLGSPYATIQGGDTLVALASRIEAPPEGATVGFADVAVTVEPDATTARASATVTGSAIDPTTRDRVVEARELALMFRKVGDAWLIAEVRGLSPIEKPRY